MLQNFGDAIKGWVAGVVIFLVALSFLLFGVQYYFQSNPNQSQTIAHVNGDKITQKQLDIMVKQMQKVPSYQAMPKAVLRSVAFNQLVQNHLLLQSSHSAGLSVSDQILSNWIASNPLFQYEGQFSPDRLNQLLYNNNLSMAHFTQLMRLDLQRQQLENIFFNSSFVLSDQFNQAQQLNNQRRDIRYIRLTPQLVAHHIAMPTVDSIKAYYRSHSAELMSPEQVKVSYIRLTPDHVRKNIHIDDQKVHAFYDSNLDSFKKPMRWRVLLVRVPYVGSTSRQEKAPESMLALSRSLIKGHDFKQVAAQNGLAAQSETLNALTADSATIQVLSQMKVGQISVPYQTKTAWQIFLLQSIKPPQQQSFALVKDKIRRNLYNDAVSSALSEQADELSNLSYTNPDSLEPAAKALGLDVQQSPWLTRNGQGQSLWHDPHVLKAAFSDDVLKNGDNSNVINLSDGSILVLRVMEHQLSKKKPLAAVNSVIVDQLKHAKAQERIAQLSATLKSRLIAGDLKQSFLDDNGLSWVSVKGLALSDTKRVPSSVQLAVFTARQNQPKTVLIVPVGSGQKYVVQLVRVTQLGQTGESDGSRQKFNKILASQRAQLLLNMFQRHLIKSAKIKRHNANKEA